MMIASFAALTHTVVEAKSSSDLIKDGVNSTVDNPDDIQNAGTLFGRISSILIFIVGAVSVIMIVFGGFRYVTSAGDTARVKGAKDTILYAVIGLVFALIATAIVSFVEGNL